MAATSLTLVGNSADSPESPVRPSPVGGDAAEILDVSDLCLGYDVEHSKLAKTRQELAPERYLFKSRKRAGDGTSKPISQR